MTPETSFSLGTRDLIYLSCSTEIVQLILKSSFHYSFYKGILLKLWLKSVFFSGARILNIPSEFKYSGVKLWYFKPGFQTPYHFFLILGSFKTLIQNPKFQPRRHLQNPIPESENLVTPALKTLTQNPKIQPRRPQPNHNPESENPA